MHIKISLNVKIEKSLTTEQLTDSVPPSTRFPSKYQVMWAGGLDPELLQTMSDGSPTTNWSPLFTIKTDTGATETIRKAHVRVLTNTSRSSYQ